MKVAIIGAGYVGQGMQKIFPDALMVDPPRGLATYECLDAFGAELAIVCVPSPMLEDGSCDASIVEGAIKRINAELVLVKSTVTPGTCAKMQMWTGKRICFSPEYMGESKYWTPPQFPNPLDPIGHGFMILGGSKQDCSDIADIFLPVLGPATRFRFMSSREAELVKYAENSFFSLKVTFANLLRRICEASGANYHTVREGWLDDPRVGPMHTAAFAQAPGFAGKCLPKDTAALAAYCRKLGMNPKLLDAVLEVNRDSQ
jgi:nucleotide sugar dehydrogenase